MSRRDWLLKAEFALIIVLQLLLLASAFARIVPIAVGVVLRS